MSKTMENFVSFELAKKLKEKGFSCEMPFAMYNEIAAFHLLTTSAPYYVCDSGFKCREYYDYEDFDEYDYIAPTISQALKWLREEKKIHLEIGLTYTGFHCTIYKNVVWDIIGGEDELTYKYHIDVYSNSKTAEQAALAGIEYVLDYLI